MDINIGLVFGSLNAAEKIASYLGIVETLNGKIDQLKDSYFTSGIRALKQAQISEYEYKSLLREARSKFNRAIDLEKEEKLIATYMGLAFCHHGLGDQKNCYFALQAIENIDLDDNFLLRRATGIWQDSAFGGGRGGMYMSIIRGLVGIKSRAELEFEERQKKVNEIKKSVRNYLNKI